MYKAAVRMISPTDRFDQMASHLAGTLGPDFGHPMPEILLVHAVHSELGLPDEPDEVPDEQGLLPDGTSAAASIELPKVSQTNQTNELL
jgi:hypothetical protein